MDHHTMAAISVCGICLDVLGGLYLAYDLLGGQHGPLRLLTRLVTYSVVFGIGYGLGLGLIFGIAAGVTTGVTIAIELNRTARAGDYYPLWAESVFSLVRSAGFAVGLYPLVGLSFALAFGILITLGQTLAYSRGMRPGVDYAPSTRPRLTRRQVAGAVIRTAGYVASAMLCSAVVSRVAHPWLFAFRVGLTTGIVTAFGGGMTPFVEYYADAMPERRLGVIGIGIVFCGFVLQSVQYLVVLLDVPVS